MQIYKNKGSAVIRMFNCHKYCLIGELYSEKSFSVFLAFYTLKAFIYSF